MFWYCDQIDRRNLHVFCSSNRSLNNEILLANTKNGESKNLIVDVVKEGDLFVTRLQGLAILIL